MTDSDAVARFASGVAGPTALFLDTSALVAYFDSNAAQHDSTRTFFRGALDGDLAYRPLYTNTYVVDELATTLQSRRSHALADRALAAVFDSETVELVYESRSAVESAREQFGRYDDHEISFTDHLIAIQMRERNIDHVLTYDGDFVTLGLTPIPHADHSG